MTDHLSAIHPDDDKVFHNVIAPFIQERLDALQTLDNARRDYVGDEIYYIFTDHSHRVATMGRDFAQYLNLDPIKTAWFYQALLIHDCGKALLPVDIWDRTEKPTEELKALRRTHSPVGADAISKALPSDHPFTPFADRIARWHHEHMNGSGTLGITIAQQDIWLRIACIVDSYDGMKVWRPHYKDRDISPPAIIKRLAVEKGPTIYDGELVEKLSEFLKL